MEVCREEHDAKPVKENKRNVWRFLDTQPLVPVVLPFSFSRRISTDGKAYFSTEQPAPGQNSWLPLKNVYQERKVSFEAQTSKRAQAPDPGTLLVASSMKTHLRWSNEFQRVYRAGKRHETYLMTVFVLPNSASASQRVSRLLERRLVSGGPQ